MEVSEQDKLTFDLMRYLMRDKNLALRMCQTKELTTLIRYFLRKYKTREDLMTAFMQSKD